MNSLWPHGSDKTSINICVYPSSLLFSYTHTEKIIEIILQQFYILIFVLYYIMRKHLFISLNTLKKQLF